MVCLSAECTYDGKAAAVRSRVHGSGKIPNIIIG